MLKLYRLISIILIPIIFINIYFRILNNKEDKKRFEERFGKASVKKPAKKKLIWIHAASVGEFKSSKIIIESYYKNYTILVSTTTKTAADYALKYYSKKIIHQYAPYDVTHWVERYIKFWKPELVIWIESDLWPNTLALLKKNKIKSILLNARISPESYSRWKKFGNSYEKLIETFSAVFAQSKDDLKRIKNLTNKKIEFIGNLKLSNKFEKKIINQNRNNRNFSIMIASSHTEEEELLVSMIKKLFIKFNNIQFYFAPRHINRATNIQKLFRQHQLISCIESNKKNQKHNIMIIDSFGKLSKYFNKSDIVFLGGSISNHGGHNPVEPAKYKCAIISGNNVFNWQNIYKEMLKQKACFLINNIEKLEKTIEKLITNKDILKKTKQNALKYANKKFFNEEKLKDVINSSLIKNA
ncbi:MAG: hypothetical protein CMP16_01340 [Rickettsiales bacterium]|nr:hypothetical protein [Rickettsiales bacterium]